MKFIFPILITVSIFLFSCTNAPVKNSTNSIKDKYFLDIQNNSYKIKIKEVDRDKLKGFTASHLTNPYLEIHAECISLGALIDLLMDGDENSLILKDQDFYTKFYSVLIEQNASGNQNDSIIKDDIFKAYNLIKETKIFNVDTVLISIKRQPKSLEKLDRPSLDALKINYHFYQDSVDFENFNLEEKLMRSKYTDYKNLVLVIESPVTCKIGLVENEWTTKQTKLGYEFEYVSNTKRIQREKVLIRRNYLVKN